MSRSTVKPLLEALNQCGGWIGIVSSSDREAIETLVQAVEIGTLVDCVISGVDCPAHKPDPTK